jgi:hypothetical protein
VPQISFEEAANAPSIPTYHSSYQVTNYLRTISKQTEFRCSLPIIDIASTDDLVRTPRQSKFPEYKFRWIEFRQTATVQIRRS